MKLVKQSSGKTIVKMSRKEWTEMGRKAGWIAGDDDELDGYWRCDGCDDRDCPDCDHPSPYDDWICPDCDYVNSHENSACRECATVNPDWDPDAIKDS